MGTSEAPGGNRTDGEPGRGVHVEMVVSEPGSCPVTEISEECDVTVNSVAWGSDSGGEDLVEFTMPADATPSRHGLREVYTAGSRARYQCSLGNEECPCEFVRSEFGPVSDAHATHGQLYLTFFAPDIESARAVVESARKMFGNVDLRHLKQSGTQLDDADSVVVDRNCLTDRQREVIETAHRMGYFDHPKQANAGEVAAELGISRTTLSEHLAAAQGKLLGEVLDG